MRLFVLALPLLVLASQSALASVDQGLLAMAPAGSTLLTGIDVNRMTSSRLGAYILRQMHTDQSFETFVTTTGFDPRRDVQQILFVGLGRQGAGDAHFAVLARGAFDAAKLTAAAQSKGAVITHYHGLTVLVEDDGKKSIAIAFPQPDVVVVGDLATVHSILAPPDSANAIDPKLSEQANQIGSGNDVWFATLLSGSFLGQQLGSAAPQLQGAEALQSILQSSGGMQFGDTVMVSLDLIARSPEDARSLSDLLHFAGNLAQMHAGAGNPQASFAATALNAIQVSTDGANVHATVALPEAQLEAALASNKKQ